MHKSSPRVYQVHIQYLRDLSCLTEPNTVRLWQTLPFCSGSQPMELIFGLRRPRLSAQHISSRKHVITPLSATSLARNASGGTLGRSFTLLRLACMLRIKHHAKNIKQMQETVEAIWINHLRRDDRYAPNGYATSANHPCIEDTLKIRGCDMPLLLDMGAYSVHSGLATQRCSFVQSFAFGGTVWAPGRRLM